METALTTLLTHPYFSSPMTVIPSNACGARVKSTGGSRRLPFRLGARPTGPAESKDSALITPETKDGEKVISKGN